MSQLKLPQELEPFRHAIEKSFKPFIRIKAAHDEYMSFEQSKFGGLPYLPKDFEYPRNSKGEPLFLLAQLNFEEIPPLDGFPQKGILQFYIHDDDQYGLLASPVVQDNFRVLYFEEISRHHQTNFSFLKDTRHFPVLQANRLEFSRGLAPVSVNIDDVEFERVFGASSIDFFAQFGREEDDVFLEYADLSQDTGHKIGGYPYFYQRDPRSYQPGYADYQLLLQIDADDDNGISWSDMGVCNFFIHSQDLEARDFSKVLYHWDSHQLL